MKKILILALCLAAANAQAGDAATVNGKPVRQSLVDLIIKDASAGGKQLDAPARAELLEKIITSEVIDQEALRTGIDKQADFQAKADLLLRNLRVNVFIEDFIKNNPIDDQAVQAEYDILKAELGDKEYKASHILVKSEAEARDIAEQVARGIDFGKLARERSLDAGSKDNGGDLGWFMPGTMVKPFADAVVGLQNGGYATIQSDFGWHVIHLEDTRAAQPPPLDSVRNEIRSNLQRRQVDKLVSGLRAKAKIVMPNPAN